MAKRSITELALNGRRVFIRVDFNVPISDGIISDDSRIRAALPTIRYAIERGASPIIASHLGRPRGVRNPELSLEPIATHLGQLLKHPVTFARTCTGAEAKQAIESTSPHGITVLENVRFNEGEETNNPDFSAALAELADCYVNDAFGAAHRAHASTTGIVEHMTDAAAGLLLARELEYLGSLLTKPTRPFVAVLGGSKVSGKLEVINNLLPRVDTLLIGGAMAYTFLRGRHLPTGKSLVEDALVDTAANLEQEAFAKGVNLVLPTDHLVTTTIQPDASSTLMDVDDERIANKIGVDIGPQTQTHFSETIRTAETVIWNGPMGVFEIDAFSKGTIAIAKAVAQSKGTTVIGGGDSVAAIQKAAVTEKISHVSTGGGASLEFLGGRILPGVAALPDC